MQHSQKLSNHSQSADNSRVSVSTQTDPEHPMAGRIFQDQSQPPRSVLMNSCITGNDVSLGSYFWLRKFPIRDIIQFLHSNDQTRKQISPILKAIGCENRLKGAVLNYMHLFGSNLSHLDLSGAQLEYSRLDEANLEGSILRGVCLEQAIMHKANLQNAKIQGNATMYVNMKYIKACDLNLKGEETILQCIDMDGANLPNLQTSPGVRMSYINMKQAKLHNLNLNKAQLLRVDMTKADLLDSSLENISAYGLQLPEANLFSAKITNIRGNVNFAGAKTDANTSLSFAFLDSKNYYEYDLTTLVSIDSMDDKSDRVKWMNEMVGKLLTDKDAPSIIQKLSEPLLTILFKGDYNDYSNVIELRKIIETNRASG